MRRGISIAASLRRPDGGATKVRWWRKALPRTIFENVAHRLSGRPRDRGSMMPDNIALFATIVLLLPMFYLLLAAPAFLLVRLDIVPVTQLLRGMFNSYFVALAIAGGIGTLAVLADGRPMVALGIGLIA